MNKILLQKCVEELTSKTFRKDYVLGLLEGMLSTMEGQVLVTPHNVVPVRPITSIPNQVPTTPNGHTWADNADQSLASMAHLIEKDLDSETNISLNSGR